MCKRMVMSSSYYAAIQKPNVEVVTQDVERIEPHGIVTADGRRHEVDVIALATGLRTHDFMRPMEITRADGPSGPTARSATSP